MPTLVKWIAVAVATTTGLYLIVELDRKLNAGIDRVEKDIAHDRAEMQDHMAQGLHTLATQITRVQHQLHVPDLPFPRQRPAE
jgi:hypothetical protein